MQLKENFLKTKLGVYLPFLILAFCLWYLAYSFDQDDFFNILPFYTLAFAAWIFVMRADLASGVYQIQLTKDGKVANYKLVVNN